MMSKVYVTVSWWYIAAESALLDLRCDRCQRNLAAFRLRCQVGNTVVTGNYCISCVNTGSGDAEADDEDP